MRFPCPGIGGPCYKGSWLSIKEMLRKALITPYMVQPSPLQQGLALKQKHGNFSDRRPYHDTHSRVSVSFFSSERLTPWFTSCIHSACEGIVIHHNGPQSICCTKMNTQLQRTSKDELIIIVVVGPQAATCISTSTRKHQKFC